MKNVLLIITAIIAISCNKSQIAKSKNVDDSILRRDNSTQSQNNMQAKPITYELIKDIPIEDAVRKYPPILEETFILGKEGGYITEFRIGLLNIFKEEDIKDRDIKIKEVTWSLNNKQNLTMWYQEKNNEWILIDHLIWDKESEF